MGGRTANVPINKDGSEFAQPRFIEPEAVRLFSELRKERKLTDVARDDLPLRLAYYFAELNALHPFREGNGRVQRLFLRQLLEVRGMTLTWTNVSPERMISVSIAAHQGNESAAPSLFAQIMQPL